MSQSLQGPVSWDTRALTSNQPWREQRLGKPDLWLVVLSRTASFCVCVLQREWDLSFFSSVVFVPPYVLQGQSLNHRVWEGKEIERPGDFLSFCSHHQLHCEEMSGPGSAVCVQTSLNSLDYYIYIVDCVTGQILRLNTCACIAQARQCVLARG